MDELINISVLALRQITIPRYYRTERGFVAEYYCHLRRLDVVNLFPEHTILEIEVQKRHDDHYGITQRPDLLIHIPIETGLTKNANENNFVVYAFKLNGKTARIAEDFAKLDQMFEFLNYGIGFFVNIGAYPTTYLNNYQGNYKSGIHEFSTALRDEKVLIKHSFFANGVPTTNEV